MAYLISFCYPHLAISLNFLTDKFKTQFSLSSMTISHYRTTIKPRFLRHNFSMLTLYNIGHMVFKASSHPTLYLTQNIINENYASRHEGIIGIRLVLLLQTNILFEKKMKWLFQAPRNRKSKIIESKSMLTPDFSRGTF